MTTMLIPDPLTMLAATHHHLTTYPELTPTAANIQPARATIQIYPANWERPAPNLATLADWILTAVEATPAVVKTVPNERNGHHLMTRVLLHDGTLVTLVVVLDRVEGALLAANSPFELVVGSEVAVGLLLRLVDANAAEQLVGEVVSGALVEWVPDEVEPAEEPAP